MARGSPPAAYKPSAEQTPTVGACCRRAGEQRAFGTCPRGQGGGSAKVKRTLRAGSPCRRRARSEEAPRSIRVQPPGACADGGDGSRGSPRDRRGGGGTYTVESTAGCNRAPHPRPPRGRAEALGGSRGSRSQMTRIHKHVTVYTPMDAGEHCMRVARGARPVVGTHPTFNRTTSLVGPS